MQRYPILVCVLVLLFSAISEAQTVIDPNSIRNEIGKDLTVKILMTNGNVFIGKYVSETEDKFTIVWENGQQRLRLARREIATVEYLSKTNLRDVDIPNGDVHFITPTAFPLEKGKVVYRNYMLFLNGFRVGVTERLSLGVGVNIFSIFEDELYDAQVNARYIFPVSKKLNFALSTIGTVRSNDFVAGLDNAILEGLTQGLVTIGTEANSLTLHGGVTYSNDNQLISGRRPPSAVVGFSGRVCATQKLALFAESIFRISEGATVDFGFQLFEERGTFSLGLLGLYLPNSRAQTFPLIGYSREF